MNGEGLLGNVGAITDVEMEATAEVLMGPAARPLLYRFAGERDLMVRARACISFFALMLT